MDLIAVSQHAIDHGEYGTGTCPIARVLKHHFDTDSVSVNSYGVRIHHTEYKVDADVSDWIKKYDRDEAVAPIEIVVDQSKNQIRIVKDNDFTRKESPKALPAPEPLAHQEERSEPKGKRPWWKLWGK